LKKTLFIGLTAGLAMGVALFLTGAIASRLVYGIQMAPDGKFEPEQLNVWYFVWTKLVIGAVFGMLLALFYDRLPLTERIHSGRSGMKYAFGLWVVVSVWGLTHRVAYETFEAQNQIFWLIYTLGGFLGLGYGFGAVSKRWAHGPFRQRRIEEDV
jgi:hypothetical protein